MAFSIKYRKLFEVRLLHSYFLKGEDEFYDMPPIEQDNRLEKTFYSIADEVEFTPTEYCTKIMKGQRLRMIPSAVGFSVWVEVKEIDDDPNRLTPFIMIDNELSLKFRIKAKKSHFLSFSNLPFKPSIKGGYYWSNTNTENYPSINLLPSEFNNEIAYEMGTIVKIDDLVYKANKNTNSGVEPTDSPDWDLVKNFYDTLNGSQPSLISSKCKYHFTTRSGKRMAESTFTLTDSNGTKVEQITFTEADKNNSVVLNLSALPPDKYKMQVSGKDKTGENYKDEKTIYLNDMLFNHSDFGLVEIIHQERLNEFRLLEEDGQLRQSEGKTKAPVFEIRIGRRATYWKYLFKEIDLQKVTDNRFDAIAPNAVLKKTSLPLSMHYQDLRMDYDGESVTLPNPGNGLVITDGQKNYSEIYLLRLT